MSRHVVTIEELGEGALAEVCAYAQEAPRDVLGGQGVALVFEQPSLRTRSSSAIAVRSLGGWPMFITDDEIGLDRRESVEDVGRTLAEYYSICALRVRDHRVFERLDAAVGERLGIVNLLSRAAHPTQAVADVVTMAEHFTAGRVDDLAGLRVAYVGDVTNVARSLAVALRLLGAEVVLGAPDAYQLGEEGPEDPRRVPGGSLRLASSAREAVAGAHVVYTDSWISMGLEAERAERLDALREFQVTEELLDGADPAAVVMHCLPAHRGEEVDPEVLDSPRSLVWRQVAHRVSAMRGALRWMKEAP